MKNSIQYTPFARKYRPVNFSELKGQEVLTKILSYAILNNRLAQGYLLTGIRGVGKTTSARIIAKTINCTNPISSINNISPCEKCQNCESFNQSKHPDIIEMDAASNTSVIEIRKVIESSEYRPLLGKYKVFIIDEVHMLSNSAFNALLKILEEPPMHVVFIFATTEVQKIPLTIISRCQRYDLRRLTFDEILGLLEQIAQKENLCFNTEALKLIASKSDGSAREAIVMLDQSVSLSSQASQEVVTVAVINQMLGVVDTNIVIEFVEYILNDDAIKAVELVNKIYLASANLEIFIESISDFIAYLSKSKALTTYSVPIYSTFNTRVTDILIKTNLFQLTILWQIFSKGISELKMSHNQLITTEMLVIKAVYSQTFPTFDEKLSIDASLSSGGSNKLSQKLPEVLQPDNISKIYDFLKYLHLHNEMEIYYLLLNQVEIKNFSDNVMQIAGKDLNVKTRDRLGSLLFEWTAKKWSVIITPQTEITSLKDKLSSQLQSSKDWQIVKENFAEANIADIILKK